MAAPKELRLALGMRGGVSLAVWIGGACAEIDELRSSGAPLSRPPSQLWHDLLRWSGYRSVVVDVMAGASAGGLNGVVYAAAQAYGFDVAGLRSAWLQIADLEPLVRTAGDDGASLLRGDAYFLAQLDMRLRELIGDAAARPAQESRLDLTLTTTLVEPAERGQSHDLLDVGVDQRFASTFRFRHRGTGWLTDFPSGPEQTAAVSSRLALAARATSSFPFAFEGALVRSKRPRSFAESALDRASDDPSVRTGRDVDMNGVFGDARSDGLPFVTMDGGVLDNIPLGRAITAIADAPADNPTRRVLLYVRPGGAGGPAKDAAGRPVEDPAASARLRSTWGVVNGIVRSRIQSENIRQDLDLLHAHNALVARSTRLRRIAFEDVEGRARLGQCATAAYTTYRLQRTEYDAQVVRRLLDDPVGVLGEDPFPEDTRVDDRQWRAPLAYWEDSEVAALDTDLGEVFRSRLLPGRTQSVLDAGTGPVSRIIRLLLDWARYVESCGIKSGSAIKARLYEALLLHVELVGRIRRLAWVTLATRPGDRSASKMTDAIDRLLQFSAAEAEILEKRIDDRTVPLDGLRVRLLSALDDLDATHPTQPEDGTRDVRELLVSKVLVPSAVALAQCRIEPAAEAETAVPTRDLHPGAWIHRAMRDHGTTDVGVEDLAALEVISFGEALVGEPTAGRIDFVELTSDNPTPIAPWFKELVVPSDPDASHIYADRKLAGNELKNFSAFLRRSWRDNDWLWGRLDAVPTLVDLLVTPEALTAAAAPPATEDGLLADLKRLVLAVDGSAGDGSAGDWGAFLEREVWEPRSEPIRQEVRAALAWKAGSGNPRPGVGCLREALTASRQWQVFAQLRASSAGTTSQPDRGSAAATPAGLSPDDAVADAATYRVGLETLTDPPVETDAALIQSITAAGRRALRYNLPEDRVPPALLGVVDRVARLLSWAWLDRSASFWLPTAALTAVTLFLVVVAPAVLTDEAGPARWWAAGAVPGVLLLITAGVAAALHRYPVALGMLVVGAALAIAAWTSGDNALGIVAMVAAILSLVLGALIVLARSKPGRRRVTTDADSPNPSSPARHDS
jgi:patatin-related protein